jgi:hypothetical protein
MELKKLLFVTKFNDLSFNALQSFLCLRKAALSHIVLANVIEREKVAMHRGLGYQKSEEIRLRETANIRFIDWAETLFEKGLEVGVYIVVGNMVRKVIEAAKKEEADLIVIGRSPQGFLEQLYSGSHITELIASLPYRSWSTNRHRIKSTSSTNPSIAPCWPPIGPRQVCVPPICCCRSKALSKKR